MLFRSDIPDDLTRPVQYVSDVLLVGALIREHRNDFPLKEGEQVVERVLAAKYVGWSYEQEVRVHADRAEKDEETGQYFVDFSERLMLKEVIAGAKFAFSKRVIEEAVAVSPAPKGVSILKAHASPDAFEIVVDENWFI